VTGCWGHFIDLADKKNHHVCSKRNDGKQAGPHNSVGPTQLVGSDLRPRTDRNSGRAIPAQGNIYQPGSSLGHRYMLQMTSASFSRSFYSPTSTSLNPIRVPMSSSGELQVSLRPVPNYDGHPTLSSVVSILPTELVLGSPSPILACPRG